LQTATSANLWFRVFEKTLVPQKDRNEDDCAQNRKHRIERSCYRDQDDQSKDFNNHIQNLRKGNYNRENPARKAFQVLASYDGSKNEKVSEYE
jgi:hypothetical protein